MDTAVVHDSDDDTCDDSQPWQTDWDKRHDDEYRRFVTAPFQPDWTFDDDKDNDGADDAA